MLIKSVAMKSVEVESVYVEVGSVYENENVNRKLNFNFSGILRKWFKIVVPGRGTSQCAYEDMM